jgi:hypothetical protein
MVKKERYAMKATIFAVVFLLLVHGSLHAQLFTKITVGPVVNDDRYSEGSSWGDINNDNFLDLFVPDVWEDKTNILFINNGNGTFTEVTTGPVVTDRATSSGGSFGDFNNDGYLDLFVQNWFGDNNHFYLNQGDGTFTKVTSGDIVNDGGNSFNSSVTDYDNDGNLDIFVDNGAFTGVGENNFLYHGNGDGTFTKVTTGDIVNDGEQSLSSGWCDYDEDGDVDLFVANGATFDYYGIDNFLYQNNGDGSFTKITEGVVVSDSGNSTGVSWGDYDNDGDFDLFVANWGREDNFLYRNDGGGTFTKITEGIVVNDGGHSVAGAWGDVDNDGDLDLYVTNDYNENNCYYENNGDGTFTKITEGAFVNDGGRSNGAVWGDYNMDGFLDLFVPNGQIPSQSNCLYRNNRLSGYNWINITCIGTISNGSAVGTKVRALASIDGQPVWQLRQVSGQTGFNAQNSYPIEYGLKEATIVDSIVIVWPSGTVDIYTDVEINTFYQATEGQGLVEIELAIEEDGVCAPVNTEILVNFPNPSKGSMRITYSISQPSFVILKVYDTLGREIQMLVSEYQEPDLYSVYYDARGLPNGIYFCKIQINDYEETRKMLFMK